MHNPGSNDTKEATLPKTQNPSSPKTKDQNPVALRRFSSPALDQKGLRRPTCRCERDAWSLQGVWYKLISMFQNEIHTPPSLVPLCAVLVGVPLWVAYCTPVQARCLCTHFWPGGKEPQALFPLLQVSLAYRGCQMRSTSKLVLSPGFARNLRLVQGLRKHSPKAWMPRSPLVLDVRLWCPSRLETSSGWLELILQLRPHCRWGANRLGKVLDSLSTVCS